MAPPSVVRAKPASAPMAVPKAMPADPGPDVAVREQLERVLRSETFQQADRLKRFLAFIVEEALAGRQAELKEYVIGAQVFRKEESFDPRTDPIVRVQARRLRAKLIRYYREEGRADALIFDLPKGGYAPVFKHRDTPVMMKRSISTALISRNAIAVQVFADHSPAKDLGYFCQALRDELVHALTQLPGLRVLATHDGPADESLRDAVIVLGGSVRQSGDRLRIGVHLIEGARGCYLWSESIDAFASDAFAAQERVAGAVVQRIEPELREGRRVSELTRPSGNLAAQNLYLQGRYHLNQRTEEGLLKAVDFFEKALAEGAQFAPAHSGLADAFCLLSHYGVLAPAEAWTRAASHAAQSVMLDNQSTEAHTSLAHVKATQEWNWPEAEREFRRAISLDPSYATARHWYAASCLAPLGRLDEALDEQLAAQALDPVSSIVARDVAVIHYYRRDFETALEQCDHTIALNPHFAPAYWTLGVIQEQRHEFDEAIAAFRRAAYLSPKAPRVHGALGRTFALSGRKKLAIEVLKKLETFAQQRYVSPLEFAWIHFALHQEDIGFAWLKKAYDDRAFDLISIKVDPRFDPLRHDERFRSLIARLALE